MPQWEARLGTITVRLDGELDGATCDHLRQLAAVAMAAGATDVRVDASGVTYAGSAAIRALVEARATVVERGGRFELVLPSPPLQKVLEVVGLESVFA